MTASAHPAATPAPRPLGGLQALFAPASIAIIGASEEMSRAGGRALGILKMVGYAGRIHPVHPTLPVIQGLPAAPSLAALPAPADLAVIALGPERVVEAIRDCGRNGVKAAAVFADGFTPALRAELTAAIAEAHARTGLRMLGPNTIGFRALGALAYGTFAGDIELGTLPGPTAFIAQSGGMSTYFGATCLAMRGIGTRYLIDTGNEVDIEAADCVAHIADDPQVSAIALMLEGARNGRRLVEAIRAAVRAGKTVVALKMARSQAGLAQAASHTGALAGRGELFDAELRAAGACVAASESELLDAMKIAALRRIPAGRGVGVVTSSGGFGILALDAIERAGLQAPAPSIAPTEAQRADIKGGKFANPFDFSSSLAAGPRAADTAIDWITAQPEVHAVISFNFYSAMRQDRQEGLFRQLTRAAAHKPVFVSGVAPADFEARMRGHGVLFFEDPTRIAQAIACLVPPPAPTAAAAMTASPAAPDARPVIGGAAARERLAQAGLPQVRSLVVRDLQQAQATQAELGGRVVLKVESDAHAHKSDFGLVTGPLAPADLPAAWDQLLAARAACGARAAPVVMQPFERGAELALGAYIDPIFGPSVMVASGGIFLEILKDARFAAAPIDAARAKALILELAGAPLLLGARGRPLADIDAAAQALARLSQFIAGHAGEIAEVDVNPLIVFEQGKGAVAVDALLVPANPAAAR